MQSKENAWNWLEMALVHNRWIKEDKVGNSKLSYLFFLEFKVKF